MSYILLVLLFISALPSSWSQQPTMDIQAVHTQAQNFIFLNQADSALVLLDSAITYLDAQNKTDDPLFIKLLASKAFAQEVNHDNEQAITNLIKVIKIAEQQQQIDALADAYVSIARLYEKLGDLNDCLDYLIKGENLIHTHQLDSLKPRFYCRKASYFRINEEPDSALLYAYEALKWSQQEDSPEHLAVSHMLLAFLLQQESYQLGIHHLKATLGQWKRTQNYNTVCVMMNNIASIYLKNNLVDSALIYNDSSLIYLKKHPDNLLSHNSYYRQRAGIFQAKNNLDSALFYTEKYYKTRLEQEAQTSRDAVAKINAEYQTERNKRTISEQAQKLKEENQQKWMLILILSFLSILGVIFAYFYQQLKKAKHQTEQQAVKIKHINQNLSQALEQQKILLGEIHHRVKNNLQIVISMLEWQAEDATDQLVQDSFMAMANRIYSIASIHKMMYKKEELDDIALQMYIQTLCEHIQASINEQQQPVFDIQCVDLKFNLETLIPLGILINELITNSIKHAVPPNQATLTITIHIQQATSNYHLHYQDNGTTTFSLNHLENSSSMGSYLIRSMVRQLKGKLELQHEAGTIFAIDFYKKTPSNLSYEA